jgi:hypothetical protein
MPSMLIFALQYLLLTQFRICLSFVVMQNDFQRTARLCCFCTCCADVSFGNGRLVAAN